VDCPVTVRHLDVGFEEAARGCWRGLAITAC
jgi:hypothetical protein